MFEFKDLIGWGVAIVVALIGVSSVAIKSKKNNKKENNTVKQNVKGKNNVVVGGDVIFSNKEDDQ